MRLAPIGRLLIAAAVLATLSAGPTAAQISPGPLSAPHAQLEGAAHCLDCHARGEGVSPSRCLDCHELLAERISAGAGFHAQPDLGACESCHVEHHGREFELVWWGEAGMEAFDHSRAGFRLEGAHRDVACRDCHREAHLAAPADLTAAGKDPARTFLGLGTGCVDCHSDPHDGRFAPRGCVDCHDSAAWKPVRSFDHDLARFRLTGRHRDVACAECHPQQVGEDGRVSPRFTGLAFGRCLDCHTDPHAGRLGATCTQCHDTAGWRSNARAAFDHDRTRYPLSGAHLRLDCAACHGSGPFRSPRAFAACRDCHADAHLGQLASRADRGACEACHTIDRFVPSTFDLADHAATLWPLEGAHLAVPCVACHEPLAPAAVRRAAHQAGIDPGRLPARVLDFHPPATSCPDCHRDPHGGEVDRFVAETGCETCHTVRSWSPASFDHERSGFALRGRHVTVACASCHPPLPGAEAPGALRMRGVGRACAGCHDDRHGGQLAVAGSTDCARCHGETAWQAVDFDHERDARFSLAGAHARVPCAGCHKREMDAAGASFVRYRPLATECEACHGPVPPAPRAAAR